MLTALLVFLPFGFGITDYIIGKKSEKTRNSFAVITTFIELALSVLLLLTVIRGGSSFLLNLDIPHVFASGLSLRADGFRSVYSLVTALMWAFTTLFSQEYFKHEPENLNRYYLFVLATLGATQGVMLSGDLMTTFVFFEILSLTSFTWVMHEETEGAIRAGYTYLFIAIIGGLVLFMGLALLQYDTGTLMYAELPSALSARHAAGSGRLLAAGICILVGFGCKAGMFPVHVWLPKAHPVAPAPASALLSGVLTKVGIYGILMTTVEVFLENALFGWIVLILGTITMFLGALLALFSVNLKRTLACSSMSQIGFILTGIGMTVLLTAQGAGEASGGTIVGGFSSLGHHAAMAMSGTMLHMVNHSMLKLCLFCAAGVVVMNAEALDLNEIRGFGRNKTLLKISFFLGLVGISGVPMFNGYASKTLLHEAITSGIHEAGEGAAITLAQAHDLHVIEWIFLISGGCTFAYMLKLFICVFVEKNKDLRTQEAFDKAGKSYMNAGSTLVVFGTSILFILLGQKPVFGAIASLMTGHHGVLEEFRPLSFECISGGLISLSIGLFLYLVFIRRVLMTRDGVYADRWPAWLVLEDLLYRPMLTKWLPAVFGTILSVFGENKILTRICRGLMMVMTNTVPQTGEDRLLKKAAFMVFYFFAAVLKVLSMGTDALIMLSRKTVLRERVITGKAQGTLSFFHKKRDEIREGYGSLTANFSFAMMFACIGMLLILGVIVFYIVRR